MAHPYHIYAKRITVDKKSDSTPPVYDIDIDFCIKFTPAEAAILAPQARIQALHNMGFRILVIQSTMAGLPTKDKQWEWFQYIKNETELLNEKENYRIFSLNPMSPFVAKQDPTEYIIPFLTSIDSTRGSFQAPIDTASLYYIFFPYFLKKGAVDALDLKGCLRASVERVKNNGSFIGNATQYFLEGGMPWDGYMEMGEDLILKTDSSYPPDPPQRLFAGDTPNATLTRVEILDQLKSVNYDFSYESLRNKPYFSEIFLSRGPGGTGGSDSCRFSFSIDYLKMVQDTSKFPWLFKKKYNIRQLLKHSKIESLKVFRRRASTRYAINKLLLPVISKSSTNKKELIVASADQSVYGGAFQPNSNRIQNDDPQGLVYEVGNIREIKIIGGTSDRRRTFTGTDISMKDITDGVYQYGVEVVIKDPAPQFLKVRLSDLSRRIAVLEDYFIESLQNYNNVDRRFTKELVKKRQGTWGPEISGALSAYKNLLRTLVDDSNINFDTLVQELYKLICPINGLPENVTKVIGLMTELSHTIESLLEQGSKSKTTKSNRGYEAPSVFKTVTRGVSRVYEKWFDSLHNSGLPTNTGYYFVTTRGPTDGHATITWDYYDKLATSQITKTFSQVTSFRVMMSEGDPRPGAASYTVDLNASKYNFFTPIRVGLGGNEIFDLSSNDVPGFYDLDKYNSILNEILRFNYNMAIVGDESLYTTNQNFTKFDQKLQNGLVDFFAERGCTIDNIASFSPRDPLDKLKKETSSTQDSVGNTWKSISNIDPDPSQTDIIDRGDRTVDALDSTVEESVSDQTNYEDDTVNPNNILLRLSEDFMVDEDILNPENFDLTNPENIIRGKPYTFYSPLPNQLKALHTFYSGTKTGEQVTNFMLEDLGGDHRDQFGFLYMNFLNLMQVEILTGFKDNNLLSPIFEKMKTATIPPKTTIFARTVRYTNESANLSDLKLNFPVYFEYFFIDNTNSLNTGQASVGPGTSATIAAREEGFRATLEEAVAPDNLDIITNMVDSERLYTELPVSDGKSTKSTFLQQLRSGTPAPQTPTAAIKPTTTTPTKTTTPTTTGGGMPTGGGGGY